MELVEHIKNNEACDLKKKTKRGALFLGFYWRRASVGVNLQEGFEETNSIWFKKSKGV
jgi:hypothetical protein